MRRVIYLTTYPAHLVNLVCSACTLRRVWDGPIDVITWPESESFVKTICEDGRLGLTHVPWEPLYRGKSDSYVDKTRLIQSYDPDDIVVFLDADTAIQNPIDDLFLAAECQGYAITQFCDWVTTGRIISSRLRSLQDFPTLDQDLIQELLTHRWPSLNNGVFAASPTSEVLPQWHQWTYDARSTFIPDEKTVHLCMAKYGPLDRCAVLMGGAWNCSPKYQPANLDTKDVVIWHFHGDSNLREQKSSRGFDMWMPLFRSCLKANFGSMQDWYRNIGNKYLNEVCDATNGC